MKVVNYMVMYWILTQEYDDVVMMRKFAKFANFLKTYIIKKIIRKKTQIKDNANVKYYIIDGLYWIRDSSTNQIFFLKEILYSL